jgi:hypothetical protein
VVYACTSVDGTFETCPPILRMSVHRGVDRKSPWSGQTDANDPAQVNVLKTPIEGKAASRLYVPEFFALERRAGVRIGRAYSTSQHLVEREGP